MVIFYFLLNEYHRCSKVVLYFFGGKLALPSTVFLYRYSFFLYMLAIPLQKFYSTVYFSFIDMFLYELFLFPLCKLFLPTHKALLFFLASCSFFTFNCSIFVSNVFLPLLNMSYLVLKLVSLPPSPKYP